MQRGFCKINYSEDMKIFKCPYTVLTYLNFWYFIITITVTEFNKIPTTKKKKMITPDIQMTSSPKGR